MLLKSKGDFRRSHLIIHKMTDPLSSFGVCLGGMMVFCLTLIYIYIRGFEFFLIFIDTIHQTLSTTLTWFNRHFSYKIKKNNRFLTFFLELLNLSEFHLYLLLKFCGVLHTPFPILAYVLKRIITDPQIACIAATLSAMFCRT